MLEIIRDDGVSISLILYARVIVFYGRKIRWNQKYRIVCRCGMKSVQKFQNLTTPADQRDQYRMFGKPKFFPVRHPHDTQAEEGERPSCPLYQLLQLLACRN